MLDTTAARRLSPEQRSATEEQLAARTDECTPSELQTWGTALVEALDQAMLCRAHHRQIHVTEWICRIRDGLPEFIPPVWIDPLQNPRRKASPHLVRAQLAQAG